MTGKKDLAAADAVAGGHLLKVEPVARPGTSPQFKLGERVRTMRTGKGLTLAEVATRAGLARSTLSKIENDHSSPTFEVLQKLAVGLDVAIDELFANRPVLAPIGRWNLTKADHGQIQHTGPYTNEFLCTGLTQKSVVPSKARINARSLGEFGDWIRHEGDDFLLVLEGAIELHTEFYQPQRMEVGDCAYFDARMGHLCISVSEEDALVLWVGSNLTVPA